MKKWIPTILLMIPARWVIQTLMKDIFAVIDNQQIASVLSLVLVVAVMAMVFWITSYIDLQREVDCVKQEAASQGRTFIEHLGKIFPDDIMEFCTENQGKETALAKGLGKYRKEKRIDKLDVACLKEAFRYPAQSAGGNPSP